VAAAVAAAAAAVFLRCQRRVVIAVEDAMATFTTLTTEVASLLPSNRAILRGEHGSFHHPRAVRLRNMVIMMIPVTQRMVHRRLPRAVADDSGGKKKKKNAASTPRTVRSTTAITWILSVIR